MPLPLTVSCSSKIQIGFTFLVPAYPGYPGKEAVKWLLLLLLKINSLLFLIHNDNDTSGVRGVRTPCQENGLHYFFGM